MAIVKKTISFLKPSAGPSNRCALRLSHVRSPSNRSDRSGVWVREWEWVQNRAEAPLRRPLPITGAGPGSSADIDGVYIPVGALSDRSQPTGVPPDTTDHTLPSCPSTIASSSPARIDVSDMSGKVSAQYRPSILPFFFFPVYRRSNR